MYDKTPYFYGTGRRKSSVARVRLYQGTGKITINDRDIDDYFGLETLKLIVRQPLALTETDEKFDIVCRVSGYLKNKWGALLRAIEQRGRISIVPGRNPASPSSVTASNLQANNG